MDDAHAAHAMPLSPSPLQGVAQLLGRQPVQIHLDIDIFSAPVRHVPHARFPQISALVTIVLYAQCAPFYIERVAGFLIVIRPSQPLFAAVTAVFICRAIIISGATDPEVESSD
jgi:hypothetical protein